MQDGTLEKLFHLRENGTTVKTEIMAGITTFMTMAYILAVNPSILSVTGMDKGALLTVTALASCFATLLMAAFANYPFALSAGMGLNAFFAFTVVKQPETGCICGYRFVYRPDWSVQCTDYCR